MKEGGVMPVPATGTDAMSDLNEKYIVVKGMYAVSVKKSSSGKEVYKVLKLAIKSICLV